jgi:adenylate kinase family enzyme
MTSHEPVEMGRRIVVWGVTGSGKTTLARHISDALSLPRIELDAIRHANGWDSVPWDVFRDTLVQQLDDYTDGWVLDGSYSAVMDTYLSSADTLIWLHLPWRVAFWRLFKRTVGRAWTREPLYHSEGPRESWRMTFLSPRSILWWSISSHRGRMRRIPERIATLDPHVRVHELCSQREVNALVASVNRSPLPRESEG